MRDSGQEEGVDWPGAEAETRGPGDDQSEQVSSRWQSMLPDATGVDQATFKDLKREDHGAQHTR